MLMINPKIDPINHHKAVQALGFLPYWVRDFCLHYYDEEGKNCNLVEYMTEQYGFGKLYKFGSKLVGKKLVSEYEEDEDMDYLAAYDTPVGTVYFFQYAIVALPVPEENDYFITRMD